jgi:hypothetical protein
MEEENIASVERQKKDSSNVLIIILVVVLIFMCCCCLLLLLVGWYVGDYVVEWIRMLLDTGSMLFI